MDTPPPPSAASPLVSASGRVSLLRKGTGTTTSLSYTPDRKVETRLSARGEATPMGEFDSVEDAEAAARERLTNDPLGQYLVINDAGLVLGGEYDEALYRKLAARTDRRVKAVIHLVGAAITGSVWHANQMVPSWTDTALCFLIFYALLWLLCFTFNCVETAFVSVIITVIVCLSFPLKEAISKAVLRHKERQQREALPAMPAAQPGLR